MSDFTINDGNTITIYREMPVSEWPDFSEVPEWIQDFTIVGSKRALNSLYGFLSTTKIKKIIENKDAVIVFWVDGSKTVVKRMLGDNNDIYSAVAQALAKKIYGSTNHFHKIVDEKHTVQKERSKYHGE